MSDSVETEIGLLPETWPVQRLGDVFETQLGKMLSQKAHGGDAPKPYLRNKNVQWGSIDTSDMLEMDFSEREKAKFQLHPGDLLVCEGGFLAGPLYGTALFRSAITRRHSIGCVRATAAW